MVYHHWQIRIRESMASTQAYAEVVGAGIIIMVEIHTKPVVIIIVHTLFTLPG